MFTYSKGPPTHQEQPFLIILICPNILKCMFIQQQYTNQQATSEHRLIQEAAQHSRQLQMVSFPTCICNNCTIAFNISSAMKYTVTNSFVSSSSCHFTTTLVQTCALFSQHCRGKHTLATRVAQQYT